MLNGLCVPFHVRKRETQKDAYCLLTRRVCESESLTLVNLCCAAMV